jgi:type I restriction enzyme S subunit
MWSKCDALSQGTSGKDRIKPEKPLTVTVPLPPLFEQRRIVAKIEQLASKIGEARGLRDNAKVEAIALEASETEECFRQVTRDGIESVPFEVVCDRITVGQVSSMRHAYCDSGIPFLRSQNVRRNRFEPDGLCYIGREFHDANSKSKVQPGHVVIVQTGFVGTACVIPDELSEANCSDLVVVHPGKGFDSRYASRFLNSLGGLERAPDASVGSAQRHYNVKVMRKTLIPVPPLPEQRRIVAYLADLQAKVDQLKTLQAQTAAELDALLPSILDRAFRWEL